MTAVTELPDIPDLLPQALLAAVRLTSARDARTRAMAWRMIHSYLASPVALEATVAADKVEVTELHAELLSWCLDKSAADSTGTQH